MLVKILLYIKNMWPHWSHFEEKNRLGRTGCVIKRSQLSFFLWLSIFSCIWKYVTTVVTFGRRKAKRCGQDCVPDYTELALPWDSWCLLQPHSRLYIFTLQCIDIFAVAIQTQNWKKMIRAHSALYCELPKNHLHCITISLYCYCVVLHCYCLFLYCIVF